VERSAKLVGVDFATPDLAVPRRPPGFDWPVHHVLLGHGVLIAEHLRNLRPLTGHRIEAMFLALAIEGSDGSPARVIARRVGPASQNCWVSRPSSARDGTVFHARWNASGVDGQQATPGKASMTASLAFAAAEPSPAPATRSGRPFVGREPEIEALESCLRTASAGRGQLVAVVGEAGIG